MATLAFFVSLYFLYFLPCYSGINILLVPVATRSHVFEMAGMAEKLAEQGHHASLVLPHTFPFIADYKRQGISVIPYTTQPDADTYKQTKNEKDIVLFTNDFGDLITDDIFVRGDRACIKSFHLCADFCLRDCETMLGDEELSSRIKKGKFDIAVVDSFFFGYCGFLVPIQHGIPFVTSFSGGIIPLKYRIPDLPSFSPIPLGNHVYTSKMTFYERLMNTYNSLKNEYKFTNLTLLHKYAPETQTWDDLLRRAELFFIHRDIPLERPYVTSSNVVRTHGLTLREGKPLSPVIENAIGNREKVVLMTFGSMISAIPDEIVKKIVEAFAQSPQLLFIVRLNAKLIKAWEKNVPQNVKLVSWLPQQDILADNRTVLFISHGGSNGQWEAVYHGVPMICTPLFSEQGHNCRRTAEKNFSISLNVFDFTVRDVVDAITLVTTDKRFSLATSRASRMLHETPTSTGEVMSYWLDHVVKYGSKHLRPHSVDMPLMEFLMFDVFAAFFTAFFLLCFIFCLFFYMIMVYVRQSKTKVE